ncbi:hypothetical protein BKA70DRAFT_1231521 [Coprinopsis sp. MPI-PUGE-AT-0042]|nr:hypothetical protein BKA70DRAFT_1231521 [Coprinopsis sp. MPI-PUGE-AT-0042]
MITPAATSANGQSLRERTSQHKNKSTMRTVGDESRTSRHPRKGKVKKTHYTMKSQDVSAGFSASNQEDVDFAITSLYNEVVHAKSDPAVKTVFGIVDHRHKNCSSGRASCASCRRGFHQDVAAIEAVFRSCPPELRDALKETGNIPQGSRSLTNRAHGTFFLRAMAMLQLKYAIQVYRARVIDFETADFLLEQAGLSNEAVKEDIANLHSSVESRLLNSVQAFDPLFDNDFSLLLGAGVNVGNLVTTLEAHDIPFLYNAPVTSMNQNVSMPLKHKGASMAEKGMTTLRSELMAVHGALGPQNITPTKLSRMEQSIITPAGDSDGFPMNRCDHDANLGVKGRIMTALRDRPHAAPVMRSGFHAAAPNTTSSWPYPLYGLKLVTKHRPGLVRPPTIYFYFHDRLEGDMQRYLFEQVFWATVTVAQGMVNLREIT